MSFYSSFIVHLTHILLAQMPFFSAAIFMLVLALSLPVDAGKCPRVCSCDSAKLTVACVGKNLTEVPPTIDEVRNSNVKYSDCFSLHTVV